MHGRGSRGLRERSLGEGQEERRSAACLTLDRNAAAVSLHHALADAEAQAVPTRLGREVEGSFDYVATGLPKGGDRVGGVRFVDDASPWSFSLVFVLPIAPL
jgi:hypothetical protein